MIRIIGSIWFVILLTSGCGGDVPPPAADPVAPPAIEEPTIALPAPLPEVPEPPPTLPPDSDGDAVPDAADNCPTVGNADQRNTDADPLGDACDSDDDADGLPDAEELSLGHDKRFTDPRDPDTDADGLRDGEDNCPAEANPEQTDTDNDTFGVPCDCQDGDTAINPSAVDEPEIDYRDRNCDGIDGDVERAIFVAPNGDDAADGSRTDPIQTVGRGIALATAAQKDLYLLAGTYAVPADIAWPTALKIFGGFATPSADVPFGARDVHQHLTILRAKGTPVLTIAPPAQQITLDGIVLKSESAAWEAVTLRIEQAQAIVRYSQIHGSPSAHVTAGVEVAEAATLTMESTWVDAAGLAGMSTSTAIRVDAGTVTLINNILRGGAGNQTAGVVLHGGTARLAHNTIDGGSTGAPTFTAGSLRFAAASPYLLNNIFVTQAATEDQIAVWCEAGHVAGAVMRNNLFAVFPSNVGHPLFVNCDGEFFDYGNADAMRLGIDLAATVEGTLTVAGSIGNLFIDPAAGTADGYRLKGTGAGSADSETAIEVFGVARDYMGAIRVAPYDVGALEE